MCLLNVGMFSLENVQHLKVVFFSLLVVQTMAVTLWRRMTAVVISQCDAWKTEGQLKLLF